MSDQSYTWPIRRDRDISLLAKEQRLDGKCGLNEPLPFSMYQEKKGEERSLLTPFNSDGSAQPQSWKRSLGKDESGCIYEGPTNERDYFALCATKHLEKHMTRAEIKKKGWGEGSRSMVTGSAMRDSY